MPDDRFDPRAYWTALKPADKQRLGEAALLLVVACDGQLTGVVPALCTRWEHAETEAWKMLEAIAPDPEGYPDGPDLAALGIRSCRQCGCTDQSACVDGCSWVETDLCSACATAELANG